MIIVSILWAKWKHTEKPFISLFPIGHYNQNFSDWINPSNPIYEKRVLSQEKQSARYEDFKKRNFGDVSPWNISHIEKVISQGSTNDIKSSIVKNIEKISNKNKSGKELNYAENFRLLTSSWVKEMEKKCNVSQFDHLRISVDQRAIIVAHSQGRELPTEEVSYHHYTFAGEGYPFDTLQNALIWAGTPVYVLGESEQGDWVFVQTPSIRAWIKSTDIARVDDNFISQWQQAAEKQLMAIVDTEIPILDEEGNKFWNSGFIGMVFPGSQEGEKWRIMIPVRDEHGKAQIHFALLLKMQASVMPLVPTPRQFIAVMQKLIGRPYGWGGLYLLNDCASELKNLFTPFGIWLPMHSSDQVNPELYSVKIEDLAKEEPEARLEYLQTYGDPFMTIVYIGGHVVLYLGTYPNPNDPQHHPVALTYQNVWKLSPNNPAPGKDRRSIIGKAVLLPILPYYPEDPGVASDINYHYFTLGFLDS